MRIKLDENFDVRIVPLLVSAGHDVETVRDEQLSGEDDERIFEFCIRERRTLITLDLDFSNPLRFPPRATQGIVVVRPKRPIIHQIRATLMSVLPELGRQTIEGKLWIVEPGRIRVFDPSEHDDS